MSENPDMGHPIILGQSDLGTRRRCAEVLGPVIASEADEMKAAALLVTN
jgi:hypothetical protein